MGKVRGEPRSQEVVARGEPGGVEKPGQQQGAIGVCSQRDRVEYDCCSNTPLLVDGDMRAFEASSHASSSKAALSDFPHAVDHGIEDEVVGWVSKPQAAPRQKSVSGI